MRNILYKVISIFFVLLAFASGNKGKTKKVTILQPTPDHDARKIPLSIGNPVRVRGVGVGVVTDTAKFRVKVKFNANGREQWFFKSWVIRL